MRLIIVRHGETIENQKRIMQGHMPGTISSKGKIQVKKLAKRLKNELIAAIYSSDLRRAADTAKEIKKFHPKAAFHLVEDLRERNLGSLTGTRKLKIKKFPKDVESNSSLMKRAKRIIDNAFNKYNDNTVVFVGHQGINKALITLILGKPSIYITEVSKQLNTSIGIFEIREDKKHIIHLLNCTKHLESS